MQFCTFPKVPKCISTFIKGAEDVRQVHIYYVPFIQVHDAAKRYIYAFQSRSNIMYLCQDIGTFMKVQYCVWLYKKQHSKPVCTLNVCIRQFYNIQILFFFLITVHAQSICRSKIKINVAITTRKKFAKITMMNKASDPDLSYKPIEKVLKTFHIPFCSVHIMLKSVMN